jgi:hypothetical protein
LQGLEDTLPNALLGPTVEPFPDRIPVTKTFRQIAPRGASLADPENSINKQTVVFGYTAVLARLAWQHVLNPVPVGIRNRMAVSHLKPSMA